MVSYVTFSAFALSSILLFGLLLSPKRVPLGRRVSPPRIWTARNKADGKLERLQNTAKTTESKDSQVSTQSEDRAYSKITSGVATCLMFTSIAAQITMMIDS